MRGTLLCWLLVSCAAGCGPSAEPGPGKSSELALRAGASVDEAPRCGVALPHCAEGLACITVPLTSGAMESVCVNADAVCEQLECASGECVVLLSYPGRVMFK
ncbi:hypothetical protein [Myxococcus sp. Y35]|uniref:hypothetical protein n=1 Tax=Pseudomyxococcus flavus TaxID=3115648 RepID=UPI003CFAAA47